MKGIYIPIGLAALVVLTGTGLFAWHALDRTTFIETTCEMGLPNLSRPEEIPADHLGCAVLGPRQVVTGFVYTSFENSTLTVGDEVVRGDAGFDSVSTWFSGTDGLMQRGGDILSRELEPPRPGLCGGRMAKLVVEGWMTVSEGGFGHLNSWDREFYAYRIVSATAPTETELAPYHFRNMPGADSDTEEFCRERERPDFQGI